MHHYLIQKLVGIVERGETVIVSLTQKFHAASVREGFEGIEGLGTVQLELLDGCAGDGIGDAKAALMLLYQVQKQLVGGQIALGGNFAHDLGIEAFVKEIGAIADIEYVEVSEAVRLMDLEIENDV